MQAAATGSLVERMKGAARLDSATYEEVERDTSATMQAAIVVVAAAIASGIGALGDGGNGFIGGVIEGILGWVAFSAAAYFVGTRWLATTQTEADLGQLLRTLGFARTPALITVLGFIPVLGAILGFIAGIWLILTTVVALRQALEMETGRAIGTALLALVVEVVVGLIIGLILGVTLWGFSGV